MKKFKKEIAKAILATLNSGLADTLIMLLAFFSFYLGQESENMAIFSASGGVMTVFGLLKMIKFSTLEQYLKMEETIKSVTGMTGPPTGPGEENKTRKAAQERKRRDLEKQLGTEFKGITLTVFGTLTASYGSFIPIL